MTTSPRTRILFLCTGNSARSIMAEFIANACFGDLIITVSAGSQPKGEPHPLALETLRFHGIDPTGAASKSWDHFKGAKFDLVITLCGSATRETCPVFPGAPTQAHWGFPDPPATDDPATMFESVYRGILAALEHFTTGTGDIATRAAATAIFVAEHFPAA